MSHQQELLSTPGGDSQAQPDGSRLDFLERENAELRAALVVSLRSQEELAARVRELEEKLNTNSRNSSLPPSQERPGQKAARTRNGRLSEPGRRKRGGQKGHKGHARAVVPDALISETIDVAPPDVCECGDRIEVTGEPYCLDQAELPPIQVIWRRYRLFHGKCRNCGRVCRAPLPVGVVPGLFGANLLAFIGVLVGGYQLGRRGVVSLLSMLLNMKVSAGTLSKAEGRISQALSPIFEEARSSLTSAHALNCDETGSKSSGKRSWIWLAASASVAVFLVSASRGAVALTALLGEAFSGFMTTDRWHTYNRHATKLRQLCWAHLLRDFQKIMERGGASWNIGWNLVNRGQKMFGVWGRFKDGLLDREQMKTEMQPIREAIERWLEAGTRLNKDRESKTVETCQNLLKLSAAMWTFLEHEGIEPTNNRAERLIRNAVLWRNRSQGTWSERGDRYIERLLTTVVSLRLQDRDPLPWLAQALRAQYGQGHRPSLVTP